MKLLLLASLLAAAVPALAGQSTSPEQVYIDCVGHHIVRLSPSGRPFDTVLQAASEACNHEAASMQSVTPAFADITREIARRIAFLYFVESRERLANDRPRGRGNDASAPHCSNLAPSSRCVSQK